MDVVVFLFILMAVIATLIKVRAALLTVNIARVSTSCASAWRWLAAGISLLCLRDIIFMFQDSSSHDSMHWFYYAMAVIIGVVLYRSIRGLHKCYTDEISILVTMAEEMSNKVLLLNKHGKCLHVNAIWQQQTGLNKSDSMDLGWRRAILPQDIKQFDTSFSTALEYGITLEQRVRLLNSAGQAEWHYIKATPVRDTDCNIEYWFTVITNINDYVLTKEGFNGRG